MCPGAEDASVGEGESARNVSVGTVSGVATLALTSTYEGLVSVTVGIAADNLASVVGVYSTSSFANIIAVQAASQATYDGGSLLTGSLFAIYVRNLSNREFDIAQVDVTKGAGGPENHFSDSPITDNRFLSEGKLSAGEFAAIGYVLDDDVANNTVNMFYRFSDSDTGQLFVKGAIFSYGD